MKYDAHMEGQIDVKSEILILILKRSKNDVREREMIQIPNKVKNFCYTTTCSKIGYKVCWIFLLLSVFGVQ